VGGRHATIDDVKDHPRRLPQVIIRVKLFASRLSRSLRLAPASRATLVALAPARWQATESAAAISTATSTGGLVGLIIGVSRLT
jgi:hypothetical protein